MSKTKTAAEPSPFTGYISDKRFRCDIRMTKGEVLTVEIIAERMTKALAMLGWRGRFEVVHSTHDRGDGRAPYVSRRKHKPEALEAVADTLWSILVFAGNPPSLMPKEEREVWLRAAAFHLDRVHDALAKGRAQGRSR